MQLQPLTFPVVSGFPVRTSRNFTPVGQTEGIMNVWKYLHLMNRIFESTSLCNSDELNKLDIISRLMHQQLILILINIGKYQHQRKTLKNIILIVFLLNAVMRREKSLLMQRCFVLYVLHFSVSRVFLTLLLQQFIIVEMSDGHSGTKSPA